MNIRNFITVCVLCFTISACTKQTGKVKNNTDPVSVFNELWNIIDQRYALFSIKDTSWGNVYDQYRNSINSSMSETELFKKLSEMLKSLKDGHVVLMSPFDTSGYDQFYTTYSRNFNFNNIVRTYLHNEYKTVGPVIYKVANHTGYIYYASFAQDITDDQLKSVFNDMGSVKGLIIDVRSNTGGNTLNAERLAKVFMPERNLVKYELIKKGPGHNDFFNPQPFYLTPSTIKFTKPVVILTNRTCYSACNDFVLYVSQVPNVRSAGDQTGGGGGIPFNYILSNGWKIQYTATLTLSALKEPVENGIKPDVYAGISSLDEAAGKDPIIEKAIQLLQ